MNYFIGDKRESLSLDQYISEGEEGKVYKEGNEAVKIYYSNWRTSRHAYLDEYKAERMTKIATRQILLPRRLVYDENDEFCGYSTTYINSFCEDGNQQQNRDKERKELDKLELQVLKQKIEKIYSEVRFLSEKGILIGDIFPPTENYIYNGEYWILDPGCHTFTDRDPQKVLERNIRSLNAFFLSNCFSVKDVFTGIRRMIDENGPTYTVSDLIEDNGKPLEKTIEFRNRMRR